MGRPVLTSKERRAFLRCVLPLGLLIGALNTCAPGAKESTTGGETHFLTACNADAVCGSRFACVCGLCTEPCAQDSTCQSLSGSATCVPATDSNGDSCPDSAATNVCGVACTIDTTCQALSNQLRCVEGFCRPGSADSDAGSCTQGQVTAGEVLFVGDSFFATSHQIPLGVEQLAQNAGVLGVDEHYRDKSALIGNALAVGQPTLVDQYTSGRADGVVKVVIMSGGGADVLAASCNDPPSASCPALANAATAASDILKQMAQDGVQHIVYCFYPDPVDAALKAKMDVLRPLVQAACQSSPVPCHWLDLRPTFADRYAEYILPDGMNPTDAGSTATAAAIWQTMQAKCVAQ